MKRNQLIVIGIITVLVALFIYKPSSSPSAPKVIEEIVNQEYQLTATQNGQTALVLTKNNLSIETKTFEGMGEFVTTIAEKDAGNTHFWALYYNGEFAGESASTLLLNSGDTITWKLEKIDN